LFVIVNEISVVPGRSTRAPRLLDHILAAAGVDIVALAKRAGLDLDHARKASAIEGEAREPEARDELAAELAEQAAQPAHVIEHDPRSLSSPERNPEAGA
jgi:hypothetical protein